MKKLLSLLLALTMVSMLLAACAGGANPPPAEQASASAQPVGGTRQAGDGGDGEIVLSLYHRYATENQTAFMSKIIALFEEQNPGVKVEVSTSGRDEYRDKLKVVLGSNNIPDVFFSYAYENANEIIREGKCLDITGYYEADDEWKGYYIDGVLDGYTYEDALYGAPYRVSISVILYNKEIYSDLGLSVPSTMDELLSNCKAIQAAGIQPFTFANSEQWPAPQWIGAFNQKLVAPEVMAADYSLKGDFSDPGYLKAFDVWSQLLAYASPDANSKTYSISEEEFASGSVAMMWGESVSVGDINLLNPDCSFGCFAVPAIVGGAGDNTGIQGGPEGFVVSSGTAHPEEAAKLVKFLSSPEVGKLMMADLQWFNGCADVVNASAEGLTPIEEAYTFLNNSTGLLPFMDTAMNSSVASVYIASMQSYVDGGITAEGVMEAVRTEAEFCAAE
ncbi:ABC transporter substrate-binding protein [Anaerotruncus massiliensis (ex Togo et al. 2019)]|uniref:ABC transporter substrate-binding protein n=1 Tax=Anaerotruncus TaxID=244127 RepID=UPI000C7596BE|nr:extracellular solute-binding protein [Anaerotruncus massiliensis (ex Togo et al. 2019)]GKH46529.1 sugar ABC transporter substrate-binding protein [Oscillospiraceae bacterium]